MANKKNKIDNQILSQSKHQCEPQPAPQSKPQSEPQSKPQSEPQFEPQSEPQFEPQSELQNRHPLESQYQIDLQCDEQKKSKYSNGYERNNDNNNGHNNNNNYGYQNNQMSHNIDTKPFSIRSILNHYSMTNYQYFNSDDYNSEMKDNRLDRSNLKSMNTLNNSSIIYSCNNCGGSGIHWDKITEHTYCDYCENYVDISTHALVPRAIIINSSIEGEDNLSKYDEYVIKKPIGIDFTNNYNVNKTHERKHVNRNNCYESRSFRDRNDGRRSCCH